jgi:asparagine synthase (glutamine-hydrolysing)
MAAVAGVSGKGHREDVQEMLRTLRHRANGPWEVIENETCTLGVIHPGLPKKDRPIGDGCMQHVIGENSSSRAYVFRGKLFLQRDPLGITPLYYGRTADGDLCFASEVKALLSMTRAVHELLPGTIYDGQSRNNYFRL